MSKKLISIMSNCYNEEENVDEFYQQIKEIMMSYQDKYEYDHLFMDNSSTDGTVKKIKAIIEKDKHVRLIVNTRNFGQIRSPYYGILQVKGDAVVSLATDFQDPPYLIREFIAKWEEGYKNVIGVKHKSKENKIMFFIRKFFYRLIAKISEVDLVENFTGFGLYDKQFIDVLRGLDDPYPYFRGLIAELGFSRAEISYAQPKRERGTSTNNWYSLYDLAMLGFVNHSKLPLRLSSFLGFFVSFVCVVIAIVYFIYKLLFWSSIQMGIAPLIIGMFFFGGVQLFFLGIIGEYVGAIFTQVKNRPLVIERERVNFD
ncbi:MAG: glycosyltransferase family 2 protein [Pseudomonadota bacterium]